MQLVATMPAITIEREQIETDTSQTAKELMPFDVITVQAINEIRGLLV